MTWTILPPLNDKSYCLLFGLGYKIFLGITFSAFSALRYFFFLMILKTTFWNKAPYLFYWRLMNDYPICSNSALKSDFIKKLDKLNDLVFGCCFAVGSGLEVEMGLKEGSVNFHLFLKTEIPFSISLFACPSFFNVVTVLWFYCSLMNSLLLQISKVRMI